jgi:hypothetical protein
VIGHLDRACVQGVRDARAGRYLEPVYASNVVKIAYRRAYKRECRRMAELGALAQLELWEAAMVEASS